MIKRLLLILALSATALACNNAGSSTAPDQTGPAIESAAPSEAAPSLEASPS